MLVVSGSIAAAAKSPRIELPEGERAVKIAWADNATLMVLVTTGEQYAYRSLDLNRGSFGICRASAGFEALKPAGDVKASPEFYLADNGASLAVVERARLPLKASVLQVFRLDGDRLLSVSTRTVPTKFWVDQLAWDNEGRVLFISARHYLYPEQPYSIGKLAVENASFKPLTLKANLDLIDQLVFIPQRQALAARCASYHGEYPLEQLIALIDPNTGIPRMLHSRASELQLKPLADGRLLLYDASGSQLGFRGDWLLDPRYETLQAAVLGLVETPGTLLTSPDSTWLGFLTKASTLGVNVANNGQVVALQRAADGKTMATSEASVDFAFSPNSQYVCTVGDDGRALFFYPLSTN